MLVATALCAAYATKYGETVYLKVVIVDLKSGNILK